MTTVQIYRVAPAWKNWSCEYENTKILKYKKDKIQKCKNTRTQKKKQKHKNTKTRLIDVIWLVGAAKGSLGPAQSVWCPLLASKCDTSKVWHHMTLWSLAFPSSHCSSEWWRGSAPADRSTWPRLMDQSGASGNVQNISCLWLQTKVKRSRREKKVSFVTSRSGSKFPVLSQ